ncbi:MAG: hypothetical protein HC890_20145 [Chloroflexaceae bacterium]|nr:hypothetical protein [Chloroflexaceae bacterium]
MVNFGLNSASLLGIFLAVAGASLYFLRSIRPEVSRDHDIFFAAVGLLCGFILLFQGWRLDPILQFGQFLLTGAAVFFAVETIRLRGVATTQAKRGTPIVDDDRPVSSRVRVQAELDQLEPYEDEEDDYEYRRLRGYQDPRTARRSEYEEESPRPARSRPVSDRPSSTKSSTARPKRSTRPSGPSGNSGWEDRWEEEEAPKSSSRPRRSQPDREPIDEPPQSAPKRRPVLPAARLPAIAMRSQRTMWTINPSIPAEWEERPSPQGAPEEPTRDRPDAGEDEERLSGSEY